MFTNKLNLSEWKLINRASELLLNFITHTNLSNIVMRLYHVVISWDIFCLKIYKNNIYFFSFLKFIFYISILKWFKT